MNKKVLNPILIILGLIFNLIWWGPFLSEGMYSPALFFLLVWIGSFISAFGIINYSSLKWYWKLIISTIIAFIIGIIMFFVSGILFYGRIDFP